MYERVGVRPAVGPHGRFLIGGQTMVRQIALLLSLAVCLAGCGQKQARPEDNAVSAILKLGGGVKRDEELPGRPVVAVDLRGAQITDAALKHLKELKGLQTFLLYGTQITDAGLKELKELKGLQVLVLNDAQITDAGLKDLKELKGLRHLDLSDTPITDAGLKDLKQLKGLQWLFLDGTKITDAGLKDLKELKGLKDLDLRGTKITDAGLEDLKQALPETSIIGP